MAIYTVLARGHDEDALAKARFLREGFSWPAFVLAQVWLLYHRLWLALLIWIVLEVAYFALVYRFVPVAVSVGFDLLAHIWIGFEGPRLRVAKEARRATLTDLVEARDHDEAEALFFRRMRPDGTAA